MSSGNKSIPDANTTGSTFIELVSQPRREPVFIIFLFKKKKYKGDLIE